jgi:hypothetical protein
VADAIDTFEKALAYATSLPGTARGTSYGKPAAVIAENGRSFVIPGREPATSFVVQIDADTVEMLKTTDPETYWQTPHYEGYGAVLVRYDSADPDRVRHVIAQARDQAAAKKPVRKRAK